jgi:hypothetical protein
VRLSERVVYGEQQRFCGNGLLQDEPKRGAKLRVEIKAGGDNDRDAPRVSADAKFLVDFKSWQARESEIQHDGIGILVALQQLQHIGAIIDGDHAEAGAEQDVSIQGACRFVVFNDEDGCGGHGSRE